MAAVCIHGPTIGALKLALKEIFPTVKSSHMSEAIAVALGFQTNAAMRPHLSDEMPTRAAVLHDGWLVERLSQLGYPDHGTFTFEALDLPSDSPAASLRVAVDVDSLLAMGLANPHLYHLCRSLQERGIKLPTLISAKSIKPLLVEAGLSDGRGTTINLPSMSRHLAEFEAAVKRIGRAGEISWSMDDSKTTSFEPYTVEDPPAPGSFPGDVVPDGAASTVATSAEVDLSDILREANPQHVNLLALEAQMPFVAGGTGKPIVSPQMLRESSGLRDLLRPGSHAVMTGGKMLIVDIDPPPGVQVGATVQVIVDPSAMPEGGDSLIGHEAAPSVVPRRDPKL